MLIAVIAVAVVGAVCFLWRGYFGSSQEAANGDAQIEKIAQEMKAKGQDIRKDPMLGPEYIRLHPNEKLPDSEMPNPMTMMAPGTRTGQDAGAAGTVPPGMMPPTRSNGGQ